MNIATLGLAATIALATAGFAHAQQAGVVLDDLDADRINATQISIDFEYDGSACETVLPATVGEPADGTLAVTFPTEETGDVCTMQMVEIEVEQTVQADASVTEVEVTLLAPDGSVRGTATDTVDND